MKKENNSTDRQLVSLIHNTEWIDLSPNHKSLREYLEKCIEDSCIRRIGVSPVMVKGAFGIGKTAILNYLFHYGWTKLNIPVFQMDLSDIIAALKKYNKDKKLEKTPNEEVGQIIGDALESQIQLLKKNSYSKIKGGELFFPDFKKGTLKEYLSFFKTASLYSSDNSHFDSIPFSLFDQKMIQKSSHSNRYLLLIDEFEAKYHELKNIVDTSGGGSLRAFFDDVAGSSSVNYYCIIANGPASGYELSKDSKVNHSSSSSAAEQRRIYVKQIFTPTVKSLSQSFLKDFDKKHINFYWWLSRTRPGQIKLLKNSLQPFEELQKNSYIDFISNNDVLKNQVDDMGESNVPFLKTELFENLDKINFRNKIKDLLILLGPQKMDISGDQWKELLSKNTNLFYVSKKLVEKDHIIDLLLQDISKILKEKKKTIDKNILHKYLDLILNSIADKNNKIAFGMIKKGTPEKKASKIFLSPVLKMIDDFISIYEDENDDNIKLLLDFVRDLINKAESDDIDDVFEATYDLICEDRVKIDKEDQINIQLSLYTIQEIIEQPIGSPKLSYKNESLENKISEIESFDSIIMYRKDKNEIIFIPAFLNEALLTSYQETLVNYFAKNWNKGKNYYGDGSLVTSIVYFEENETVRDFKKWLVYEDENDETQKKLPCLLQKVVCVNINDFQLNNSQRISDFINSLCGIAVAGITTEELNTEELTESGSKEIIHINKVIDRINNPDWTEKKQIRRTITYYRDLLLTGENSALNLIIEKNNSGYKNTIIKKFPGIDKLQEFSESIFIDDILHFDTVHSEASKKFISLFLADQKNISKEVLKILSGLKDLKLSPDDVYKELSLISQQHFFIHHKTQIDKFIEDYSRSDKPFRSFRNYIKLFVKYREINDMESFIKGFNDEELIIDTYFDYLNYDNGKKYFLHGVYLSELLNSIEIDSFQKELLENLNNKNKEFDLLTRDLTKLIEDIKELIGKDYKFFNPHNIIDYTTKLLMPCITLVNKAAKNAANRSNIVIGHYISQNLETVIQKIQGFKNQLEKIYENLSSYKEKIDKKQDEVNDLYSEGGLAVALYKAEYPQGISGDYFYNNIFRPSFKQTGDSFESIFSEKYKPAGKFLIDENKIEEFKKTLAESYEKKEPDINEIITKLNNIEKQIDTVETLEDFIEKLIQTDKKE